MASSFGTAPPGSAAAVRSRLFGNKRAMTVLATCLALVSLFLFVIFLGSSSSASWSSGWARGRREGGASLPLRGGGGTPRRSYVLVIDCGSSGTRMNAFEIGRSSSTGGPRVPVVIPSSAAPAHLIPKRSTETRRAYQRVETEPGLSTFVRDDRLQDVDGEALQPLLAWAKAVVPSVHWADTPVYLLGTAGLRRLEEDERERVLGACREVLERSPFRFENSYARVIDGNDEGIYGWAALNAAEGRLLVGGPPRGGSRSRATIGALDLGGSSLEVTYEDDDEGGVDEGGSVGGGRSTEIRIGDVTYRVRTHSYAGAGLDDAYAAGLRMARDGGERTPAVVRHPCLHRGYETNETNETNETAAESLTQEERTKRKTDAPVRGAAYEDGTNRACYRLAEEVVDGLEVVIASSSRRFAAMSGFYVINRFFGLDTSATLDDVRKATDSFCAMEWDSVLTRHKDELAVETYCFRGAYVLSLLMRGVNEGGEGEGEGGSDDDSRMILGYDDGSIGGWPMGFALVVSNLVEDVGIEGGDSDPSVVLSLSLSFVAMLVVVAVVILVLAGVVAAGDADGGKASAAAGGGLKRTRAGTGSSSRSLEGMEEGGVMVTEGGVRGGFTRSSTVSRKLNEWTYAGL